MQEKNNNLYYEDYDHENPNSMPNDMNMQEQEPESTRTVNSQLLIIIQITVCSLALITVIILKLLGGDTYTNIRTWYLENSNNSIIAQEKLDLIKDTFVNLFTTNNKSEKKSSSSSNNNSSVSTKDNSVLVSNTVSVTHALGSPVPVSMSVFLSPPVDRIIITSNFGARKGNFHKGIDIDGNQGDKIYSSLPGKVESCKENSSYGKYVVVDHGHNIKTLYAHCSEISVKEGDTVKYGQQIGSVGNTGESNGAHLHFELIINQINYDPEPMLKSRNV